jgi:hypothetical protein
MINLDSMHRINGHLEIIKKYNDGREEVVFNDHNTIVSGMGVGLSFLFTLSGSSKITDYQIDRFQLGISGQAETSSLYQLSSPLVNATEYAGTAGLVMTASATQIKNGINVLNQPFGLIPFHNVTRIGPTSVRYTILIDANSANNLTRSSQSVSLNEIGLFMKNPRGDAPTPASIMVAYRKFSSILKTSDFAIIIRWTINW